MKYTIYFLILSALFLACQSNEGVTNATFEMETIDKSNIRQSTPKTDLKDGENVSENLKNLMLIKKGNLRFEVTELGSTYVRIKELVKEFEGYISRENQVLGEYQQSYNLQLRIPSQSFDAFMLSLDAGVKQYDSRTIEVDDVGEEFFDLQLRLENKKALANRYRQLLPKTNQMNEIIQLEKELQKISGDIDRIEGRMRYLKDQTAFSTISIHFYKTLAVASSTKKAKGFFERMGDNLAKGWVLITEFLLALVYIWPFILLSAIFGVLLWRRRSARKGVSKEES
ncbi:MAG: DUF4349 domain-containing protein [Bacteroidia bacterium]|nr:DUF4349 domain-containing protein [Bacteroidia bacterium]